MKAWFLVFLGGMGCVVGQPCRVEIVDKENGWPVPLVELVTTNELRMVSDNRGWIAVEDEDLLDKEVWFHVKGHGYGVAKDGFGYEGVRAVLPRGGVFRIEVERRMRAKRLGRLTGSGLFAESLKLGEKALLPESGVAGCDSVLTVRHGDGLFWVWGDTTLPGYPLGVFHSSAAVTDLKPLARPEPPIALNYRYFRDGKGKPRGVAKMPGEGPTWLSGLVSFPDGSMGATYSKIRGFLDEYETGLCVWDAKANEFRPERVLWKEGQEKPGVTLRGHPLRWTDGAGKAWLLFGDPFPSARCPDDFEAWKNPSSWETIDAPKGAQAEEGGVEIVAHRGSIAWNAFRKKWITIFTQQGGTPSALGEIWFAEAESPLGPWKGAIKVVTHDNYTFYNPRIQTDLFPEDAPYILFEGTYTAEFAN
ncbi:MAG: hypothetical protein MUF13_12050, partial [Akkermansiaceae bacterium]|nr:hypothetical protein [Akkermansiaceae bacterium]